MAQAEIELDFERVYPGLRPFNESDSLVYFGREEHVDDLLRRLRSTRFLAVAGLSGSGKSSLVRAGLIPALRRGHLAGAGAEWKLCVMRPRLDPIGALAAGLDDVFGKVEGRRKDLCENDWGLVDSAKANRTPRENLLVFIDQFEELFRWLKENPDQVSEARRFVRLLLTAIQEYESEFRIYVVLTIRSDSLGDAAQFDGLSEALNESQYFVPRLSAAQLKSSIVGPAALGGWKVDPELVSALIVKAGAEREQLPVLQHLLMRMWNIRKKTSSESLLTMSQMEQVGDWTGCLNKHASEEWDEFVRGGGNAAAAERVFRRLAQGGARDSETRRMATLTELTDVVAGSRDEAGRRVREVIDHFTREGCNFLSMASAGEGETAVDITHESLIRLWTELRGWTEREAECGRWYQRLLDLERTMEALDERSLGAVQRVREEGRWNAAWASRYTPDKQNTEQHYRAIEAFLHRSSLQVGRRRRRQRILVVVALSVAIVTTGEMSVALHFRQVALRNAGKAQIAEADAIQQRTKALQSARLAVAGKLVSDATLLRSNGQESELVPLLALESGRLADSPEARALVWEINRTTPKFLSQSSPKWSGEISQTQLVFSPDGRRLAVSMANSVTVIDTASGVADPPLVFTASAEVIAFGLDSRRLFVESGKKLRLLDATPGRPIQEVNRLSHNEGHFPNATFFSPNGQSLAIVPAEDDELVMICDTKTLRDCHKLANHDTVKWFDFSVDGTEIATVAGDTVRLFDSGTGREVRALEFAKDTLGLTAFLTKDGLITRTGRYNVTTSERIQSYAVGGDVSDASPSRKFLALSDGEKNVLINVESGKAVLMSDGTGASWLFSPNDSLIGKIDVDKKAIQVFDPNGNIVSKLEGAAPGQFEGSVKFSPDSMWLASVSRKTGRVYNPRSGRLSYALPYAGQVLSVAFSPDGQRIATALTDGTVRVFGLDARRHLLVEAISPDGKWVVTRRSEHSLRVFEASTGRPVSPVLTSYSDFSSFILSRDGKWLADLSGMVTIFEVATGRTIYPQSPVFVSIKLADFVYIGPAPTSPPSLGMDAAVLDFSRDGKQYAVASVDDFLIADTATGRKASTLKTDRHDAFTGYVKYSPDGRWLATHADTKTAYVFDATTGRKVVSLSGSDRVNSIEFAQSGEQILVSTRSGFRVFDTATGRPISSFASPRGDLYGATFSPDGTWIATTAKEKGAPGFTVGVILTTTGEINWEFPASESSIAWSPDSRLMATMQTSRELVVHGVDKHTELMRMPYDEPIRFFHFTDGRSLQTATGNDYIEIKSETLDPNQLMDELCRKLARRALTQPEWGKYLPETAFHNTCP